MSSWWEQLLPNWAAICSQTALAPHKCNSPGLLFAAIEANSDPSLTAVLRDALDLSQVASNGETPLVFARRSRCLFASSRLAEFAHKKASSGDPAAQLALREAALFAASPLTARLEGLDFAANERRIADAGAKAELVGVSARVREMIRGVRANEEMVAYLKTLHPVHRCGVETLERIVGCRLFLSRHFFEARKRLSTPQLIADTLDANEEWADILDQSVNRADRISIRKFVTLRIAALIPGAEPPPHEVEAARDAVGASVNLAQFESVIQSVCAMVASIRAYTCGGVAHTLDVAIGTTASIFAVLGANNEPHAYGDVAVVFARDTLHHPNSFILPHAATLFCNRVGVAYQRRPWAAYGAQPLEDGGGVKRVRGAGVVLGEGFQNCEYEGVGLSNGPAKMTSELGFDVLWNSALNCSVNEGWAATVAADVARQVIWTAAKRPETAWTFFLDEGVEERLAVKLQNNGAFDLDDLKVPPPLVFSLVCFFYRRLPPATGPCVCAVSPTHAHLCRISHHHTYSPH
jgi:hypothetical protein